MSRPISACLVSKAVHCPESRKRFFDAMKLNLERGGFSTYPCECDPTCPKPSDEELESLEQDLIAYLEASGP